MSIPTDNPMHKSGGTATETSAMARVERVVRRARINLLWEVVWPIIAPFVVLAALYVALSWLGLWRFTSTPVRYVIIAAFIAAALYFVWRVKTFVIPARAAAFARVEQATGTPHRPATSFADRLPSKPSDPGTEALWLAHRKRVLASLNSLRAGIPAPRLAARDPYALRFLVALLLVVGFVTAGPERLERLTEAWRGGESTAETVARIDAWVTPPAYTGHAPVFLTGDAAKAATGAPYSVPTGSIVTIRTGGSSNLDVVQVAAGGGETAVEASQTTVKVAAGETPPVERLVTLKDAQSVVVRKGAHEVANWKFTVVPDSAPQIALVGEPKITNSGSLDLTYTIGDDYGVVAAYGKIEPVVAPNVKDGVRPLYEAPALPLTLPQLRARSGQAETIRDLTSHPWAGAKVRLTLVARDEAGQEGYSVPVEFTLPAKSFVDVLAKAVVEQRGDLALNANAEPMVSEALDSLTFAPDKTITRLGTYLPHQRLPPHQWCRERRRPTRRGGLLVGDRPRHRGRRPVAGGAGPPHR